MDVEVLSQVQAEYDQRHWHHAPGFSSLRHLALHIAKLSGRMSGYCEEVEELSLLGHTLPESELAVLRDHVAPDLGIYFLRLCNLLGIDPIQTVIQRNLEMMARNGDGDDAFLRQYLDK